MQAWWWVTSLGTPRLLLRTVPQAPNPSCCRDVYWCNSCHSTGYALCSPGPWPTPGRLTRSRYWRQAASRPSLKQRIVSIITHTHTHAHTLTRTHAHTHTHTHMPAHSHAQTANTHFRLITHTHIHCTHTCTHTCNNLFTCVQAPAVGVS